MDRAVRVVVADDDHVLRQLIALNLQAEGIDVIEAVDGGEALQQVVEHRPDVIVLDVMMPVYDGLAVLRALKGDPSTAVIPVVLLTARAAPDEITQGWNAGADYYLTKPFKVEQLVSFLQTLEYSPQPQ